MGHIVYKASQNLLPISKSIKDRLLINTLINGIWPGRLVQSRLRDEEFVLRISEPKTLKSCDHNIYNILCNNEKCYVKEKHGKPVYERVLKSRWNFEQMSPSLWINYASLILRRTNRPKSARNCINLTIKKHFYFWLCVSFGIKSDAATHFDRLFM